MYYIRHGPSTVFGAYPDYSPSTRSLQILSVDGDSSAERAGLQPGDRIVAINGHRLDTLVPYYDAISRGVPGDVLTLDVERAESSRPRRVHVVLEPRARQPLTPAQTIANEILGAYPLLFLIVGLVVLLQRREDPNAWLLALLFAGFIASAPLLEGRLHPRFLLYPCRACCASDPSSPFPQGSSSASRSGSCWRGPVRRRSGASPAESTVPFSAARTMRVRFSRTSRHGRAKRRAARNWRRSSNRI